MKCFKKLVGKPISLIIKKNNSKVQNKLKTLDVNLVENCNLNCKGCSHFSPVAGEEFLCAEEFAAEMQRLSKLMGNRMCRLNLLGGEPLLHPNLNSMMKLARQNLPDIEIRLVTNGILLLAQKKEFWTACRENEIGIDITKYPIKIDYEKIKNKALSEAVKLRYFGKSGYVQKTLYKLPLDISGKQDFTKNFKECCFANQCVLLKHGKIYTCSVIGCIENFNQFFGENLIVTDRDYIDIYQTEDAQEVLDFISQPVPFCRYCKVKEREYGNEWGVSKREKSEWL